jgi:hypothetical protein
MGSRSVSVGIVSDPGLAEDVGAAVSNRLPDVLHERVRDDVSWRVQHRTHPLATGEQTRLADIAAADVPVDPDWDVTVLLTDLPRRDGTEPVATETSDDRRLAVVSLPTLGALRLNRRAERVIVAAVADLTHPGSGTARPRVRPPKGTRLRLLVGMVRANRPWRLFFGLSQALVGVIGTAALGMLNSTGWQLGATLGAGRLGIIAALSCAALTAWLIVDHELWERPDDEESRQLARLYNTSTAVTLMLGVACVFLALLVLLTAVSALVIDPQVLREALRHAPTWADRFGIVWFAASAAMIGGALGSGLEHDDVVREAAYGERQRRRSQKQADQDDDR